MKDLIDKILREWLWRIDDPSTPDVENPTHLYHLKEALEALDLPEEFITEFGGNLTEKDEDKKKDDGEDNEYEELMQHTIKDPDTGNEIKIKSALAKDQNTSVYKAAERELAKLKGSDKTTEFPDDVKKDDEIKVGDKVYRKDMLSQPEIDKLEKEQSKEKKKKYPRKQNVLDETEMSKLKNAYSKPLHSLDTSKKKLRHVTSKLTALSMGEDVELEKDEIKYINDHVSLSSNPESTRYYSVPLKTNDFIKLDLEKKQLKAKSSIINNMEHLAEKYPDLKLKFKVGNLVVPKNVDEVKQMFKHKPTSFKPQDKSGFGVGHMKENTGSNILDSTEQNALKNEGIDPGTVKFYGEKLDSSNKETFINSTKEVVSSLRQGMSNPDISDDTKKYMGRLLSEVDAVINSPEPPEIKLKKLNEELPRIVTDAFEQSVDLGQQESQNFVKDFGEVATYLHLLSLGEKVYMPSSGNFAVADLIRVKEDEAGLTKVDKVSIKSKYGKGKAEGAATSVIQVMDLIKKKMSPEIQKEFEEVSSLHVPESTEIDTDKLSSERRKDVKDIKSIGNIKTQKELDRIMKKVGFDDDEINRFNKKIKTRINGHVKKGELKNPKMSNVSKMIQEVAYRDYTKKQTTKLFKENDTDYPVDYVVLDASDDIINIHSQDRYRLGDMKLEEKSPLRDTFDDKGNIVSSRYIQGRMGARPISK